MIGLTEDQLWSMTPRTFHNLLTGRLKKEQAENKRRDLEIYRLELATMSPHMKKADRDRAYNDFYLKAGDKPKEKKKKKMSPEEVKRFLEQHKKN